MENMYIERKNSKRKPRNEYILSLRGLEISIIGKNKNNAAKRKAKEQDTWKKCASFISILIPFYLPDLSVYIKIVRATNRPA